MSAVEQISVSQSTAASIGGRASSTGPDGRGSSSWRRTPFRRSMCCGYLAEPVDRAEGRSRSICHHGTGGWRGRATSYERQSGLRAQLIGGQLMRLSWSVLARPFARAAAPRIRTCSPTDAGAVRIHSWRAVPVCRRDHAAAEMVSIPPRQDFLLGRTVIVPLLGAGAQAERAIKGACGSRSLSSLGDDRSRAQGAAAKRRGSGSFAASTRCCASPCRCFRKRCGNAHRSREGVGHRASGGEDGLGTIFPPWPTA